MKYISVKEAALVFGVSEKTILKRLQTGSLNGKKNGKWVVEVSDDVVVPSIDREVTSAPSENVSEVDTLKAQHASEIADLKAKHSAEKAELSKSQLSSLKDMADKNDKIRRELEKERREWGELKDKEKNELEVARKDAERVLMSAKAEADKLISDATAEVDAQMNVINEEKRKVAHSSEVVKQRDVEQKARLQEAVVKEINWKNLEQQYETWKDVLVGLVQYHKRNIAPVRKILVNLTKFVYTWAEYLNENCGNCNKVDIIRLYNGIGRRCKVFDEYTDTVDRTKIPQEAVQFYENEEIRNQEIEQDLGIDKEDNRNE